MFFPLILHILFQYLISSTSHCIRYILCLILIMYIQYFNLMCFQLCVDTQDMIIMQNHIENQPVRITLSQRGVN